MSSPTCRCPDYPSEDFRDQQINSRALPILVQETLSAQSADIDMVSGATYTSTGYKKSLQSALDEAHA
ncbi:FMN-binding protein [Microbacterium sp. SLBN-111]|uniref:FMN-binding protein n=1 Tax=Microbacterium sp. SLBN-111 TaxID=3377733 RepID=UPI003C72BFB6